MVIEKPKYYFLKKTILSTRGKILPKKKNIDPMLAIKLNFQDLQIQYVCKNI
jgi:hypothetical protein